MRYSWRSIFQTTLNLKEGHSS